MAVLDDLLLLVQGLKLRTGIMSCDRSKVEFGAAHLNLVDIRGLQTCLSNLLEVLHGAGSRSKSMSNCPWPT